MNFCIFSIPKPSNSSINPIQGRAISSWGKLSNDIILVGSAGNNLSKEFDTKHVGVLGRNEFGSPLVNSVFSSVLNWSTSKFFMYTNCDMVYNGKIKSIISSVADVFSNFMIVGRRTDVPGVVPDDVVGYAKKNGKLHIWSGIDYFIFNREIVSKLEIPPFAVGRIGWDNWMIGRAKQLKIPVIDATSRILAIHQDHDYFHILGGKIETREGPEAKENLRLAAGVPLLTIKDADYKIEDIA